MKLNVGGITFDVAEDTQQKLLEEIMEQLLSKYEMLGTTVQLGIKLMVRNKVLEPMERHITERFGKEAGRQMRPPRGADPVAHAARLMMPQIGAILNHATINLQLADGSDTISAISYAIAGQNSGGGSLGTDRGDGIGQNGSTEIPG